MVITQGCVVLQNDKVSLMYMCHMLYIIHCLLQLEVVRGCGRFIPRQPYSSVVYDRIQQRDKVCLCVHGEPSQTDSVYWRASVASKTLSGVTQLKIGDVCLLLYNMCGRMRVILYFDPHVFVFSSWSTPSYTYTKQNIFI